MDMSAIGSKMQATISALQKTPGTPSRAIFKAQSKLVEGTQCSVSVRKFPAFFVDEPAHLAGTDTGPTPVEFLLVSLGTCQEIVYSLYANLMGIQLEAVTVDLKGELDVRGLFGIDDTVPPGYQKITFETRITSNASAEEIQELIRIVESRCPSLDTMRRPVDVSGSVFLNGEAIASA